MKSKEELLYTKSHEWVEILDGKACLFGITDYAQAALGDIVYVHLPSVGQKATAGVIITDVESVKAVADVYSPATGVVSEINEELDNAPDLVNREPYGAWIAKIECEAIDSESFMTADQYDAYVKGL